MTPTRADGDAEMARGQELMRGNTLIYRFCLYGFLKNLKFFEPFIITVLLTWGLTLTNVGCLIAVEKGVAYTCGLPAGWLADRFGLRKTLCSCFVAYMCSFGLYYSGQRGFSVLIAAAACYGLGEALRSGVHKAIVFKWLERHDLLALKSYLNGRTRSFSLLGSAVSSLGAIALALCLKESRSIFLFSIIPYALDAIVIWSYPLYLDGVEEEEEDESDEAQADLERVIQRAQAGGSEGPATAMTKAMVTKKKKKKKKKKKSTSAGLCSDAAALCAVFTSGPASRALLSATTFGVSHRLLKDFIQPVVLLGGVAIAAELGVSAFGGHRSRIVLAGSAYCCFYLASAPASRNAYRIAKVCCRPKLSMDVLLELYGILLVGCGAALFFKLYVLVLVLYVGLYIAYNVFKPISAASISDLAGKELRASLFSGDALLQTAGVAMLAPLIGYVADTISISAAFFAVGAVLLALNHLFLAEASLAAVLSALCCGASRGNAVVGTKEERAALHAAAQPRWGEEEGGGGEVVPAEQHKYGAVP
jgi:hypothetical protein